MAVAVPDPLSAPESAGTRRSEAVHLALAGRIRSGDLAPGARLPTEKDLCAEFGVSRPMVREAVARLKADGLVNVQTRNDVNGNPVLLETNMRPSGGVGYTLHSGVNLPGLFAAFKLGLMSEDMVRQSAKNTFSPVAVRSITDVIAYPESLSNLLN